MLTKAQFSILPNRSQAQKEAKTRTFSHGNYNQILEAYLHVPTWGDSPSFQRLKVTRSKPVVPGGGGGGPVPAIRKRGRGRNRHRLEEAILLSVLECADFSVAQSHVWCS